MVPFNKATLVMLAMFFLSAQVAGGQTVQPESGMKRDVTESPRSTNEKPLSKPESGASYIRKPTQVRIYELRVPSNFVVGAQAKMAKARRVVQLDVPCFVVDVGLDFADLPTLFLNDGACQMPAPQLSSNNRMEVVCPLPKPEEPWTLWLYAPKTGDHMNAASYVKFKSAAYSNPDTRVDIDKSMRPASLLRVNKAEDIPRMFTDSNGTKRD